MEEVILNIDSSTYVKNIIDNNVKIYLKFETLPVFEEISGQNIQINNDQLPFLETAVYGKGLRMRPRSNLSLPLLFDKPTEFTIGFWLRPSWISPTISPATNLPVYYRMSLIDKSSYAYTSATGYVNADNATFSIYEECIEDKYNVMKIMLQSPDGIQTFVKTQPYKSGIIHHFWIAYYGPNRKLDVFIDGSLANLYSEDGISIPQILNNQSSVPFNINVSAIGYSSLLRNNSGLLDELVIFNQHISDSSILEKVINSGVERAIDQSLVHKEIMNYCFAFDDPTALGVTSVLSNGKNFYAGRNNGSLLKGDRTMWQVRRDFASRNEINFLKKNSFATDSIIAISNGSLQLFKSSVRI